MDRSTPNDDDVLAALKNLMHFLARSKWRLLAGAFLGGLIGVVFALTLAPYYTASTALVPASAETQTSSATSTLSVLSSLAGSGSSKDLSPFERLQLVMQSVGFAKSLLDDEIARETLFPDRWDRQKKEWKAQAPIGLLSHIAMPAQPDGVTALAALKGRLKIVPDNSGVVNVTFTAKDRAIALYMLQLVLRRADDTVRHDYLEVAEGYSNYINSQLPTITNVISRQVLTDQLNRYQQTIVMAHVSLPFAELALDPPYVPELKSGPSIRLYGAAGGVIGAVVALILSSFAFRWNLSPRWLGGNSYQSYGRAAD